MAWLGAPSCLAGWQAGRLDGSLARLADSVALLLSGPGSGALGLRHHAASNTEQEAAQGGRPVARAEARACCAMGHDPCIGCSATATGPGTTQAIGSRGSHAGASVPKVGGRWRAAGRRRVSDRESPRPRALGKGSPGARPPRSPHFRGCSGRGCSAVSTRAMPDGTSCSQPDPHPESRVAPPIVIRARPVGG